MQFNRYFRNRICTGKYLGIGWTHGENNTRHASTYYFSFSTNTWLQEADFTQYQTTQFGSSVAITTTYFLVADYKGRGRGMLNAGCVYLYNYIGGTWSLVDTIASETPYDGQRFGYSIDINESYMRSVHFLIKLIVSISLISII